MKIRKILSANDLGLTGGHQAGMLVPKTGGILPFFPRLDVSRLNPRASVNVFVPELGERYNLTYIYYNNKLHGSGTRNEYRLTGMTALLRSLGAEPGQGLVMQSDGAGGITLGIETVSVPASVSASPDQRVTKGGWSILNKGGEK